MTGESQAEQERGIMPQPPEVHRRLRFTRVQLIGLPLLTLVPVLALLGAFGVNTGHRLVTGDGLELAVEYPTRFRYRLHSDVSVTVRNLGTTPRDGLVLHVSRDYLEALAIDNVFPQPVRIADDAFIFEIGTLGPGESRGVVATVTGDRFGRHTGSVKLDIGGRTAAQASVSTFVFP